MNYVVDINGIKFPYKTREDGFIIQMPSGNKMFISYECKGSYGIRSCLINKFREAQLRQL